jgi:hypothetical protein
MALNYVSYAARFPGCLGRYLEWKYRRSMVRHFIEGIDLEANDVDTMYNGMMLVQALLLTIPPGIMTSLNTSTGVWTTLQNNIVACGVENSGSVWIHVVYFPEWNMLIAGICCNIVGIIMGVLYYALRPKEKAHFLEWWRTKGIFGAILCFLSLCTGVLSTMFAILIYMIWFVSPDYVLCDMVKAGSGPNGLFTLSYFMAQAVCLALFLGVGSLVLAIWVML